jgi:hypothetical protein
LDRERIFPRLRHGRDWGRSVRRTPRRDERGAVGIFVAVIMVPVLLMTAAFTVDLGVQRVARVDMQSLADVVALDLAWELDGSTAASLEPLMQTRAAASLARNSGTVGSIDGDPILEPVLGQMVDGVFVAVSGSEVPTAVRVTASTDVAFAFAGITGVAGGDVTRSAISTASSGACFRLGSFAAALSTGDSALNGVFESLMQDALGVNLKAIGYQGLATSYVGLDALAIELGAGTVDALVSQGNISVASLLSASSRVLSNQGDTAAAAAMGTIATRVTAGLTLNFGDLLSIGDGSSVSSSINALDLLGSAGFAVGTEVANGNNFLDTGVVWSDPWLSKGDVKLSVIEAPQQACGRPGGGVTARTAQIELETNLALELSGEKISGLDVRTSDGTNKSNIQVRAVVASATGTLTGMRCGSGTDSSPEEIRVRVDSQGTSASIAVDFLLQGEISTNGILSAAFLSSLNLDPLATVSLDLNLAVEAGAVLATGPQSATGETVYRVPPRNYFDPEPSLGSGDAVSIPAPSDVDFAAASTARLKVKLPLLPATYIDLTLDQLNLSGIVNDVLNGNNRVAISLANAVENVNEALEPVSALLGLKLNGSDLFGVPRPACGLPRLVG